MRIEDKIEVANGIVAGFTAAACAKGAVPVPAMSVAIVANNATMVARVSSAFGYTVSLETIIRHLAACGFANAVGRAAFVEAAKLLSWMTGPIGVAATSALGASTAGMQTWMIGQMAIAICQNDGELTAPQMKAVCAESRSAFKAQDFGSLKPRVTVP